MADNTSNSTLTTDLNVPPYHDDYDPTKNYYRILYRPGYAVQGRELTQMQTILQKQIDRFGKHVFREGSIVIPGEFSVEKEVDYVKVKDNDASNNSFDISDFENEIVESSSGVKAYIINVADGTESSGNTKTIFVRYMSAGTSNNQLKLFQDGETITSNIGSLVAVDTNATGKGSRFVIREGVFFAKEHFIWFPTQSIILDRYNNSPSARVGFNIAEDIVSYIDDISLLDPALESSNYSAPGANRLKLTPTLQVRPIDDTEGPPDFVELVTVQDGIITELYQRSQYNILGDELAKRTLDESGDYYVNGMSIRVRENFDSGTNGGYSNTGNNQLLSIGVEPGKAYVKGYPLEFYVTEYVESEKALVHENVSSQIATSSQGSYILANEYTGTPVHDKGTTIFLKDRANDWLSNNKWSGASAVGDTIGTAKVRTIEYYSGTLGTPNGVVAIYLTDIRMNGTNSFANTKSVTATNFGADTVLENDSAVLKEIASDILVYRTGVNGVRTVRDSSDISRTTFNFKRTSTGVSITAGSISLPIAISGESFPYGTTTLSAADKREIILTLDSDNTITTQGGVASRTADHVVTGNATSYFTRFNVGDKILFSGNTKPYYIASINSATILVVTEVLPSVLSGNTISKFYGAGDVIDLTTMGVAAGVERSVTTSPSTLSFNLNEDITDTCSISYQAVRTDSEPVQKLLRANCHVKINIANSSAGVSGPFGLGFPDVFKLHSIKNVSTGANLTSSFIFFNGQKDSYYDHAYIQPLSSMAGVEEIIVNFDFFEPSYTVGRGFFTVDSYPIDDTETYVEGTNIRTEEIPLFFSKTSGFTYDLRNCLDFRPVKKNTAVYSTSTTDVSINPSSDAPFVYETNGLRLPAPSTQFSYDFSYYLPRRDLVVINKDKVVSVIQGIPAAVPTMPAIPDGYMSLATIFVPAYPSLAPNYGKIINRLDLTCTVKRLMNIRFTMRDIGVLKQRIENLEYYASLNSLQKSALDMAITDASGLDRFKNGIFVDSFSDHSFGDTNSPDYRIIVDKKEKVIRPLYTTRSIDYEYIAGESSGVQKTGNLVTLPYTETTLLNQPRVTSDRNVELSSYRFIGSLELQPSIDTWMDTNTLPDEQIHIGPTGDNLPESYSTYESERAFNGVYTVGPPIGSNTGKLSRNYGYGGTGTAVPQDYFGNTTLMPNPGGGASQPVYGTFVTTETTFTAEYSYEETVEIEGPRLLDFSVVPYIQPQTIDIHGLGLKPNTRVWLYFDGEDMSAYAAPMTKAQYDKTPFERRVDGFVPNEGAELVTNSTGDVYIALRLPAEGKRFRVGQKEVIITDSRTNSIDATTTSKGYFVAFGLSKSIQGRVTTTGVIHETIDTDVKTKNEQELLGYLANPSCTAYSIFIKAPVEDEGVFLTSVDVYFSRKHPTLGVWFEIRAMDNAGGITRTQVPYSEVWLTADEINVSTDGYTNPTNVKFPIPIFLHNNTQYAFVMHTVGLNPDTYIWISRLGEVDIRPVELGGGKKHSSRPLTGTFYTTNNNLNWNIVDDIDLRCTFYRASFTTGSTGTAIFGNMPVERMYIDNMSSTMNYYGEPVIGDYTLTLSGSNLSDLQANDFLIGTASGANGTIKIANNPDFTVANIQYQEGETIAHLYRSNGVNSGYTFTASSLAYGQARLYNHKTYRGNTYIDLEESNGGFAVGEIATGAYSNNTAEIVSIENHRYSKVSLESSYLDYTRTDINFEMKPTSNAGVIGSYFSLPVGRGHYFTTEQAVFSRSNEIASLSGERSNKVRISMSSDTEYLSPAVDVSRLRSVFIDNLINANTTYGLEEAAYGGELLNKYISKIVTLAEDQDAEDLNVYLSAYRPPGTEVLVWCRLLNGEDTDLISQNPWIPMDNETRTGYSPESSLANTNDFREFKFVIPDSYLTGPPTDNSPGGEVQYVNSQGITFTGFKRFQIKIGLAGTNSAIVPRVSDLRVVALQL